MRCPKCGTDMEKKGFTARTEGVKGCNCTGCADGTKLYWCPCCKNVELT
jgi:hypothetical protein